MSEKSPDQLSFFGPMSSAGDSHVKTCRWLESAKEWLESDLAYGSSSAELSVRLNRDGLSWKMYPDFFRARRDEILPSSFEGWKNSGMWGHGKLLTVNTSEWPKDAAVCSLSDILEPEVDKKYYLSAKACKGILRRAEKRGKELPPMLEIALREVAGLSKTQAMDIGKRMKSTKPSEHQKGEDL